MGSSFEHVELDSSQTNYRVSFLTGSALKVVSMELVPPNREKMTGLAQYIENG